MDALTGKRVLVMGLGNFGGGSGAAQWLVSQGAQVTVTDMAPAEKLAATLKHLSGLPITYKLGRHDLADFTSTDLVVVSPAVDKPQSPFVQAARQAGVPISSEMNLFLERCPALTVGITGAVGKSTTTALIHIALQAALGSHGPHVFLGGNIGRSLLMDLPQMRPHDLVVLELSSFMLEDTPAVQRGTTPQRSGWSPHLAVITNLFANHLDRHGSLEAYAAAKQNILRFQTPADTALLNADHPAITAWASLARGQISYFTTHNLPPLPLLMPGSHNQSNARAALAVITALATRLTPAVPVDLHAAQQAICAFKGLAHRLELVHTSQLRTRQIRWYNDSKATTPEASLTALDAFVPAAGEPPRAIFIVGGYDKHIDMSEFERRLAQHAAGVLGIGQTGPALIEHLHALHAPTLQDRCQYVETLDHAVARAWEWAQTPPPPHPTSSDTEPPAIVLSPASASWGQFTNYEERGTKFAQLAKACK